MSCSLVRTSVSLDTGTLGILDQLARKWSVSKAEVMRRALRNAKEEADRQDQIPSPLQALEWLQAGGGITLEESADCKIAAAAMRAAVPLATPNNADFSRLVPLGLVLEPLL
jgi:hypothetical protein